VAGHAKNALRGTSIAQVLDFALAIPTAKTVGTEGLISCQDGQVFNLITAMVTAVCAVVTYQGAIAEQQQVRIGVEEGAAGVAAEAVDVPSVASCCMSVLLTACLSEECIPSSKAFPSSKI
jgi:hypothetical protein